MSTKRSIGRGPLLRTIKKDGELIERHKAEFDYTDTGNSIPYRKEELKKIEVSSVDGWTGAQNVIYLVYDMVKGGRTTSSRYLDQYSYMVASYYLLVEEPIPFDDDKSPLELFNTVPSKPLPAQNAQILSMIQGESPEMMSMDDTIKRSEVLDYIGTTLVKEEMAISRRAVLDTALAWVGLSGRISDKPQDQRYKHYKESKMMLTVANLFPQADPELLEAMIHVSEKNGLYNQIIVGTRWHTDQAVYNLWGKRSTVGSIAVRRFAFFMVGVLGHEFTSFTTLSTLAHRLHINEMKILTQIRFAETLKFMTAIQNRDADLRDVENPWFLLCHSLSTRFRHEFSIPVYPMIAYICIYAAKKLRDRSKEPQMEIGGLRDFTASTKRIMMRIALNIIETMSSDQGIDENEYVKQMMDKVKGRKQIRTKLPIRSVMRWIPLESNPDVLNKFAEEMGMPKDWQFLDVYSLDEEYLASFPKPVLAVLLLYPLTENVKQNPLGEAPSTPMDKLYFIRQTVGNACGTVALLHALMNNKSALGMADGSLLDQFIKDTLSLTPKERGAAMENKSYLSDLHEKNAGVGQTAAPSADSKTNLHFICFVESEGNLCELDGRLDQPVTHGDATPDKLLECTCEVVKKFMERDASNVNFNVIALARTT